MEQKILKHLERLVGFAAASNNQVAVLELLEYCKDALEESKAFRDIVLHEHNGFHSLTASTTDSKTPKVLLQAHIDVVPAPPNLVWQVVGDEVVGRGVYDMLFAAACYLAFIEVHKQELKTLDLGLMLTGDEELGGYNGVEYLLEQGYGAKVCIIPDAGHGLGDLSVSAKGVYNFTLEVRGEAHHGSRPWEGDGAARKLVEALGVIAGEFDESDPYNSTITIARLKAGDADNKGPSTAQARLDIRYKDEADLRRIKQLLASVCKDFNGIILDIDQSEMFELDTNNACVEQFIEIYQKYIDRPVTLGRAHGSSDARYFSAKGVPTLMFRPDGIGAHADDERLSVQSLMTFYKVLEEYVLKTGKIDSNE